MSFVCKPPAQLLMCQDPNCSFKHSDYKIPVETPQSLEQSDDVKPVVTANCVQSTEDLVALKSSLSTTVSDHIPSGTSQPPAKMQKIAKWPAVVSNDGSSASAAAIPSSHPSSKSLLVGYRVSGGHYQVIQVESKFSQLKEENLRLTSTLSETKLKLAKSDAEVEKLQRQRKLDKIADNFHQAQLDHSKVELNKLTLELSDQQQLNNRHAEEITRQSVLIEEKSKVEESLRAQLHQAREMSQNNRGLPANLPPFYPGWTSDYPDFYLISSDNFTFAVSRGVLSLKSPVFKTDFSTDAAKKDGRLKIAFMGEALLELLKFLCGQNFTENLPVVAVELHMAAEHYQLADLKEICEEEVVDQQQLSIETLPNTIRLANQLRSDLLMSKCFECVKKGKANQQMWKDLGPIGTECPNLFGQIGAFSGSAKNAKCPEFHFNT